MNFKTSLLFVLTIFNMFSMVYLCWPSSSEPSSTPDPLQRCELPSDYGEACSKENNFDEISGDEMGITRYWYNKEKNRCEVFRYGGCGGNQNNFHYWQECMDECDPNIAAVYNARYH